MVGYRRRADHDGGTEAPTWSNTPLLLALIAFVCIGALASVRQHQRRQHQQLRQLTGGHRRQLSDLSGSCTYGPARRLDLRARPRPKETPWARASKSQLTRDRSDTVGPS